MKAEALLFSRQPSLRELVTWVKSLTIFLKINVFLLKEKEKRVKDESDKERGEGNNGGKKRNKRRRK
jgi:hypothetical protein